MCCSLYRIRLLRRPLRESRLPRFLRKRGPFLRHSLQRSQLFLRCSSREDWLRCSLGEVRLLCYSLRDRSRLLRCLLRKVRLRRCALGKLWLLHRPLRGTRLLGYPLR